ncbi:hypothetical protein V3C99_000557, partial [Haemonchus contortus]
RPSPHRATIAHLVDEGCSAAEIARRLHINDRTVRRIVAQYRERGHIYHFQNQGVQELSMFLGFGRPDAQRSSKEEQSGKMSEASGSSSCRPPLGHIVWTDEKIFTVEVAHNSQNQRQLPLRQRKTPENDE